MAKLDIRGMIHGLRGSLARRLSLLAALMASVVFLVALFFLYSQARSSVRSEALGRATKELDNTVQRVNTIFASAEAATATTLWYVERQLHSKDSMLAYTRGFMECNPQLTGIAVAFEPYYYESEGKYFAAYSGFENDGTLITVKEGSPNYEYFYMAWYQLCQLLDRPAWTDPYLDMDTDIDDETEMVASYSMPIKDEDGRFVGVISSDLPLDWLSSTISEVKPYPNSYSIMVGRNGTYFVHPDPSKLLYESIFTPTLEREDPDLWELGHAMIGGKEGVKAIRIDGEPCYVFYKPLGDTGWSVGIVCPEKDIFAGFRRLRNNVAVIFILGILIMLLVLSQIIRRRLKPLETLAEQSEAIASGEFSKTLVFDGRSDEIGRLEQSFIEMQRSLEGYIEKVRHTSAEKASIENELRVASEIQMSMVPHVFPQRDDIDLYASMTPAKEVGGDLYDFFIQDDRLYFCVGDVSGKGVPASLFMAVTRNVFRIIAQHGHAPAVIASKLNNTMAADNDQGMFVTMFIGVVDLKTGRLDYCNCGHTPPVVCAPGKGAEYVSLKYKNIALGLMDGLPFSGETMEDVRGMRMLFYTDGLNEAENPGSEQFGKRRVLSIMDEMGGKSSKEVVQALEAAVEEHRSGALPSDDLTLLCLKLLPAGE